MVRGARTPDVLRCKRSALPTEAKPPGGMYPRPRDRSSPLRLRGPAVVAAPRPGGRITPCRPADRRPRGVPCPVRCNYRNCGWLSPVQRPESGPGRAPSPGPVPRRFRSAAGIARPPPPAPGAVPLVSLGGRLQLWQGTSCPGWRDRSRKGARAGMGGDEGFEPPRHLRCEPKRSKPLAITRTGGSSSGYWRPPPQGGSLPASSLAWDWRSAQVQDAGLGHVLSGC